MTQSNKSSAEAVLNDRIEEVRSELNSFNPLADMKMSTDDRLARIRRIKAMSRELFALVLNPQVLDILKPSDDAVVEAINLANHCTRLCVQLARG